MTNGFCSWSGGKDSCLALYKAMQIGFVPNALLTMCIESGERSRSHGLSLAILQAQADALELPLVTQSTSWQDYRHHFIQQLIHLQKTFPNLQQGVFGDIDIEENGEWERQVCTEVNLEAILPLWKMQRKTVIHDFIYAGFKAIIVAVSDNKLKPEFLGRQIDMTLIAELENLDIDACGENGEYHTVVVDGPLFKQPLSISKWGNPILHSGYWFQDFQLAN